MGLVIRFLYVSVSLGRRRVFRLDLCWQRCVRGSHMCVRPSPVCGCILDIALVFKPEAPHRRPVVARICARVRVSVEPRDRGLVAESLLV